MPLRSWSDLLDDAGGAGTDFEPIPDGDYDFVIVKSTAEQTKNSKTMYKVQCKVESGPYKDRTVWNNFVISPENPTALSIFFRQMNILGLDRTFWMTNPSDHHVAEQLQGKRFRGQVAIRSYNGSESNEIKQFYTPKVAPAGPGSGPSAPAAAPAAGPAAPAPAPAPAFAAPPPAPAGSRGCTPHPGGTSGRRASDPCGPASASRSRRRRSAPASVLIDGDGSLGTETALASAGAVSPRTQPSRSHDKGTHPDHRAHDPARRT